MLKKSLSYLMLASVLIASCASDENADNGTANGEEIMAPIGQIEAPAGNPEDEAQVQMIAPDQSFDEKGNVVDMDGNIVMPAEEAQKNNMQEQQREKATKEEIKLIEKIINTNNRFIATAKLAGKQASSDEVRDLAAQLNGEHMMLNDIARNFLDITHAKIQEDKNPKADIVNGAKGKAWDKAWVNKMLDINVELMTIFKNNSNVMKHHELKNIQLQYSEHINNERQLFKEILDRPE